MLAAKLRKTVVLARRERRALRTLRAEIGLRRAVAERGRAALGLEGVAPGLAALEQRLVGLTARLDEADAGAYGHLEAHQQWLEYLAERIARQDDLIARQDERLAQHDERVARDEAARPERDRIALRTARTSEILAATAWVEALPPSPTVVSVIVPTRGRTELLREAIESVLAQTHERFELIVVDDVSGPETAALLAEFDDPRIRKLRRDGEPGAAEARNAGLDVATGEYVAYLDDDNLIGRSWLRAIIWAFESQPEADVAYGALVTDMEWGSDGMPWLMLQPWSRRLLPFHNPIDQNALAHRANAPEARFRETVASAGDWEFAIRATREKDPIRIPVVAAAYRTKVAGRISDQEGTALGWARLQQGFLREHPLRVLGIRVSRPDVHRTPERLLRELGRLGGETAWCVAPGYDSTMVAGDYDDLDVAVDELLPDVLLVPDGAVAAERLEQLQVPFVVLGDADAVSDEETPLPHGSFFVGRWSAAAPFGTAGEGEALREALLRNLDRVRSRRSSFPDPGLVPPEEEPAATDAAPPERSTG